MVEFFIARSWFKPMNIYFPYTPIQGQFYSYIPYSQVPSYCHRPVKFDWPCPSLHCCCNLQFSSDSSGLYWICPNHLNKCWTSFSLMRYPYPATYIILVCLVTLSITKASRQVVKDGPRFSHILIENWPITSIVRILVITLLYMSLMRET